MTALPRPPPPSLDPAAVSSFRHHLSTSTRILALLGAGFSASSGLPTFRGAGGLWRNRSATSLATPTAFRNDPSLVWQFYSYRRHMALSALPNRAHIALAALSHHNPAFITLSQNVDGLSPRAGHPTEQLKLLHGSLFDVKCADESCGYIRRDDFTDPIVPALALPAVTDTTATSHPLLSGADISSPSVSLAPIPLHALPLCPSCKSSLLRPAVVWFGEPLPPLVLSEIDSFLSVPEPIDLMLVIGTSSAVWPAAGYTEEARERGARVAVINMDANDAREMRDGDWLFQGDAAEIVPYLLEGVVGVTVGFEEWQRRLQEREGSTEP